MPSHTRPPLFRRALLLCAAFAWQGTFAATVLFAPTLTEYNRSTTVKQLQIVDVHNQGILGSGVTVGLIDSGLNLSNPEFANNSHVLPGYNAVDGSNNITDTLMHGTHVAGILAAPGNGTGMYGVAPAANILMIKVFNGGTASGTAIDRGLDYAIAQGARVINMSLGSTSPLSDAGLRRATATNQAVIVVAAGNDSARSPDWPSRYAKESWAGGTMLVVGAVDASGHIASFSNRAGDTAAYYLVAPGVNILSAYGTGYAYLSGTSMAAPAVSGAAALITGYWPYLKANQVAAILLHDADDLGAPGVDAVYGHGLLNVNRALSPVGSYTYRVSPGTTVTVPLTTQGIQSTQPSVATPSAFKGLQTEVFDAYGRNFTSDEGATLSTHSVMTVDGVLGRTDRMLDTADEVLNNGAQLTRLVSRPRQVTAPWLIGGERVQSEALWNHVPDAEASMVMARLPSGTTFSAGDGGLSSMSLGLMGTAMGARLAGADGVLGNPLLGFAPSHQFATLGTALSAHWQARLGFAHSHADLAASGDVHVAELSYERGPAALNVSLGQLQEQGLLGGYSKSVLGLDQHTQTEGLTVSGAWALGAHWTLAAAYSRTQTAAPSATGMLLQATAIRTEGYGIGIVRGDTWRTGDRLSLSLRAPLRARSGQLTYSVVTGVTEAGEPIYGEQTVRLGDGGQEWVTEMRYLARLDGLATLSAVAAWRLHPDHDSTAPSQLALGLRFNQPF
jgi:hypothetical protein